MYSILLDDQQLLHCINQMNNNATVLPEVEICLTIKQVVAWEFRAFEQSISPCKGILPPKKQTGLLYLTILIVFLFSEEECKGQKYFSFTLFLSGYIKMLQCHLIPSSDNLVMMGVNKLDRTLIS